MRQESNTHKQPWLSGQLKAVNFRPHLALWYFLRKKWCSHKFSDVRKLTIVAERFGWITGLCRFFGKSKVETCGKSFSNISILITSCFSKTMTSFPAQENLLLRHWLFQPKIKHNHSSKPADLTNYNLSDP